jgi:hypothetical protein
MRRLQLADRAGSYPKAESIKMKERRDLVTRVPSKTWSRRSSARLLN